MDDTKSTPAAELVVTPATLHSLLPLHGPRLAAGRLLPLLEKRQPDRAASAWRAHVAAARAVLTEAGVLPAVADAVVAVLTAETRREIAAARARKTAKPRATVIQLRPRTAGGGQ